MTESSQTGTDDSCVTLNLPLAYFIRQTLRQVQCFFRTGNSPLRFSGISQNIRESDQCPEVLRAEAPVLIGRIVLFILLPVLHAKQFLILNCLFRVSRYTISGQIHICQLFRRFKTGFFRFLGSRSRINKFKCPFRIDFHVNSTQICQPDKKPVFGSTVIFLFADSLESIQKSLIYLRPDMFVVYIQDFLYRKFLMIFQVVQFNALRRIFLFIIQLNRNDLELFFLLRSAVSLRVFFAHHIIAVFFQILCHSQSKQRAFSEGIFDGFVILLTRHQKFVIPDGNILISGIVMDNAHQPLCVFTILFPIAQENIGIKRIADFLRQFIPDQNGFQIGFQNLIIRDHCGIVRITVHT